MHALKYILCLSVNLRSFVAATDPDRNVLPSCAKTCIATAVDNQNTRAATDLKCLCNSIAFSADVTSWVKEFCTVKELLVTFHLNLAQCGVPVRDRDWTIIPIRTVLFSLATILVIIRYLNRALDFGGMRWWWDDWCIIPAYVNAICFFSASVLMYNYGLGIDMWDLTFYEITSFIHAFYYSAVTYKIEMAFAKIAVCFFFLRIFPSRSFHIYTWTVIILNAIMGALFFFLDGFQCSPVRGAWKGWAGETQVKCIDFPVAVYTNGFVNIVLDVVMISLPIYEVSKLRLSWDKKLGAAAMFATGFILTIIGILRNVNYSKHMRTTNPTYELKVLHRWDLTEVMISLICACLPDLRVFYIQILWIAHGRPDRTTTGKSDYQRSYTGRGFLNGKNSHITVTNTFKTDYEVNGKHYDTESQTELVNVMGRHTPSKVVIERS